MASENDPIIAALRARIAGFQAALDSYLAAIALDGQPGDGGASAGAGPGTPRQAIDLPVGVFRDKGVKEAIEIFLGAGRRKQTNKEIADGLKRGGIATTSGNFESTVATALFRLKSDGKVLRFDDGWDLASSYPDSLRSRLEVKDKPKARKKKSKASKKATASPKTAATGKPKAAKASPVSDEAEPKLRAV